MPEHVITVGDRLVARVRAGVKGAAGAGGFVWVMPKRIGRLPMAELYALLLMGAFGLGLAAFAAVESRKGRRWASVGAAAMVIVLLGAMGLSGCGQATNRLGQAWSLPDVTYVHHGAAVGPVLFTKGDGSVFDERRYEPFGGDLDSYREDAFRIGSGVDGIDFTRDPQNVVNKEIDALTGWSYHGARWMAPSFARWVSPDPPAKAPDEKFMETPWALNPYQYVDQNPSSYWDPDGLASRVIGTVYVVEWTRSNGTRAQYVGSTVQDLPARLSNHHNVEVKSYWAKEGTKVLTAEVSADPRADLSRRRTDTAAHSEALRAGEQKAMDESRSPEVERTNKVRASAEHKQAGRLQNHDVTLGPLREWKLPSRLAAVMDVATVFEMAGELERRAAAPGNTLYLADGGGTFTLHPDRLFGYFITGYTKLYVDGELKGQTGQMTRSEGDKILESLSSAGVAVTQSSQPSTPQ